MTLVLNVNDREGNRYIATRFLESGGLTVLEASAGLQAIVLARTRKPALILLDIKLPDVDGLEVCRRLKRDPETAAIKIVHTSASTGAASLAEQSRAAGADGFALQPFTPDTLLAAVRTALNV